MGRSIETRFVPHQAWAREELRRYGWSPHDIDEILVEFADDIREFGPDARSLSLLTAQSIYRHRKREADRA